jgi:TMEM175 potassium channel family protein
LRVTYNRVAGQSVERLAALSDGIFAVAMTLLVLDLRVPAAEAVHSEHDLWRGLVGFAPRLLMYMMSFLTLGIFWVGQQTHLNYLARSDRRFSWIHIGFLFAVSLMPFSTSLLAAFPAYRVALLAYWLNILLLGVILYAGLIWSMRAALVKPELTSEIARAFCRRIITGQSLYAFGAALCIFNTYWSIGFIVLVQLNYAIGPHFAPRVRKPARA